MQLIGLLILLGVTATSVLSTPVELSNAERIQRGLPLKAPSRRYDGSRTKQIRPRSSTAPVAQAQTPGSAFIQVTRQAAGSKRQVSSLGYLSYDAVRGVFQVGTTGSAVSFAPPMPNLQNGPLKISSPDLFGQNICGTTTPTGTNGGPAITSFVTATDPPPGEDFGTVQCFFWTFNRRTHALTGTYRLTRQAFTLAVNPITSDLYAWTGTSDADLPPAADRITLTAVFQPVPQPVLAPGGSYTAVLRFQYLGDTRYYYAQWREFSSFAGFYPGPLEEAAMLTVSAAPTNASRVRMQFTHAGTLRTVALRSGGEPTECADDYNCSPGTDLSATPSLYDQYSSTRPLLTDAFTYPSYSPQVNGLIARFKAGAAEGQIVAREFDVGFNLPGGNLQGFRIDPTYTYGVPSNQVTLDLIPV